MSNRKPQGFPSSDPNKRSIANMTREELIALIGEEGGGSGGGGLSSIAVVFDGGGNAVPTGQRVLVRVPFDCTIVGAYLFGDQEGSITVELNKDPFGGDYPPDSTISSGWAISSALYSGDTTLSGWTTSLSAGDVLMFMVTGEFGATNITRCTAQLTVERD